MIHMLVTRYVSWPASLFALLVWIGVGYFAWTISTVAEEHDAELASMEQQAAEHAVALQLHALARGTREERVRLEELTNPQLLEILDSVEALQREIGIPVHVGAEPTVSGSEASPFKTASFTIDAQGTFTELAHAIFFLESLPIPSALDELQLERLPSPEGKIQRSLWRLVAKMRFLTTADFPAL